MSAKFTTPVPDNDGMQLNCRPHIGHFYAAIAFQICNKMKSAVVKTFCKTCCTISPQISTKTLFSNYIFRLCSDKCFFKNALENSLHVALSQPFPTWQFNTHENVCENLNLMNAFAHSI